MSGLHALACVYFVVNVHTFMYAQIYKWIFFNFCTVHPFTVCIMNKQIHT
jgi:hypothetical protein